MLWSFPSLLPILLEDWKFRNQIMKFKEIEFLHHVELRAFTFYYSSTPADLSDSAIEWQTQSDSLYSQNFTFLESLHMACLRVFLVFVPR